RAVEPALSRLARTFELTGAEVTDAHGKRRSAVGHLEPDDPLAIYLPLADDTDRGLVTFGRKETGLPFTPQELEALRLAASYLGSTLGLARRHREQVSALEELHAEGAVVDSRGSALSEALEEATAPSEGLRVYALGPLRAERDGELIRRWGGEKAGSRQAEGVFAFLFDRGELGASKDEILELIWPDVDLDRADVAFHRTLLGLRSMLSPGRRRGGTQDPIVFHNDRYRLTAGTVGWSDGMEFQRLLASTAGAAPAEALRALEEARALYRGDYLDDCPYYGDSANVEERRERLRREYVDILVELGERYAERGDRPAAANCLRQAQSLGEEDDSPRLTAALAALARPRAANGTA
ncbi:MAG: BTAD domain-containing putative transcriptional regulator, partial [Chloroflexota bacterium]